MFPSLVGTPADASHMRRSFRKVVESAGLDPGQWTPRELRHSFVSLLSDAGVPLEHISRLVGHSGTTTTETVYRKQIRPVILEGADAMDRIFPDGKLAQLCVPNCDVDLGFSGGVAEAGMVDVVVDVPVDGV